jgi:hypothetical protein
MRRLICISVLESMDSNIEQRSFLDFLRDKSVRMADSMPAGGRRMIEKSNSSIFYSYNFGMAN